MNRGSRQCQNCKQNFVIEPEDFQFYEKIKVPPPTFCPECRLQRRMTWRNERSLYKRKCDAPGHSEEIITMYAPESGHKIYDAKFWWSDGWDPMSFGSAYDFNIPFFKQFSNLLKKNPLLTLSIINSINSDYTNFVDGNKNCYLFFGGGWNENVNYSARAMTCKDSQDILVGNKNELCYETVNCFECYKLLWSTNCKNCSESYFLHGCRGCNNCFGCANLVNKSYYIFNKPHSKEDYFNEIKKFDLHTRSGVGELRERFRNDIYLKTIHKFANIVNCTDVTGDNINNSKNAKFCFDIQREAQDSKYLMSSLEIKDAYDGLGEYRNPLSYENVDNNVGSRQLGSVTIYDSHEIFYSFNCHASSNLFGCVGLRNKNYCILNTQYAKEDYEKLVQKIKEHMDRMPYMDKKGRRYGFGEFFPSELSPFAYNETLAQEYFPLFEADAEVQGQKWRETSSRDYKPTIGPANIPDGISALTDNLLQEVFGCAHQGECTEQCTTAFRVVPQELQFYKRLGISLPILCPNCRHYQRLKEKNPPKLWHRKCTCAGVKSDPSISSGQGTIIYTNTVNHFHGSEHCPNEFETSYAPERKEIVYCESCYQAEVV